MEAKPYHRWKWDWPWQMVRLRDWFFMVDHSTVPVFGGWHFHVRVLGLRSAWFLPAAPDGIYTVATPEPLTIDGIEVVPGQRWEVRG